MLRRFLFISLFFCSAGYLSAQELASIPPLTGRVVDAAGVLQPEAKGQVEATLASFEASKGSQIAVLIVTTTAPEAIEQYSMRVAESWKIGRKNVDDGVILVIAMQDRAFRLEVGYALEGVIPDIIAKRILEDILKPFLRSGDVGAGVHATVDALIKKIYGEELPLPKKSQHDADGQAMDDFQLFIVGGFLLTILLSNFIKRPVAAAIAGVCLIAVGFLLAQLFISIISAVIVFIFAGLASGGNGSYRVGRGGGSWSSGSFGSSGGSSGGGFSGGGGSFGGGGASGRW